jgi:hypothetical protein
VVAVQQRVFRASASCPPNYRRASQVATIPHLKLLKKNTCLGQVADTEYFRILSPSLTLGREIPSHFRFHNEPIIQIVAVLCSTRFVDFVSSLADPISIWLEAELPVMLGKEWIAPSSW